MDDGREENNQVQRYLKAWTRCVLGNMIVVCLAVLKYAAISATKL